MSEATELLFTLAILGIPSCTLEERIKVESLFGFDHGEHQKDNHGDWRRKRAERKQRGGWESI